MTCLAISNSLSLQAEVLRAGSLAVTSKATQCMFCGNSQKDHLSEGNATPFTFHGSVARRPEC